MAESHGGPPAPIRMFIKELETSNENFVRIMGTVVMIRSQILKLDDGTGVLTISTNNLAIKGSIGQTIDVIMRRQNKSSTFHAECIVWNVSPQNETLRRMEIVWKGDKQLGYACPPLSKSDVQRAVNHGGGLSLKDLSMVLEASSEFILERLQELQLEGQIYCDREGNYVPL